MRGVEKVLVHGKKNEYDVDESADTKPRVDRNKLKERWLKQPQRGSPSISLGFGWQAMR
jgi:hypothetical protein